MNTEKPEPPEGYRLFTKGENPLPMDALVWRKDSSEWHEASLLRGGTVKHQQFYATRAPIPATASEKSEAEPACTCADWGMMDHLSGCAVTIWKRSKEKTAPCAESPEKDAEIARLRASKGEVGAIAARSLHREMKLKDELTALRAQLTAKDAIIGDLEKEVNHAFWLAESMAEKSEDSGDAMTWRSHAGRFAAALTRAKENQP